MRKPFATVCMGFCAAIAAAGASPKETCDVLVVGAGPAGIAAAAESGRAGAKTVLVEQGFQVGGNMTSGGVNFPGLFHAWGRQVIDGVGWEIVTNAVAFDGGHLPDFSVPFGRNHPKHQVLINIPIYVALAEETLQKSGVTIHYYEAPVEIRPVPDGWLVKTMAIGDTRFITCKQLVDCTGNGAVTAMLGFERLRGEVTQPGTFIYSIRPNTDLSKLDSAGLQRRFEAAVRDGRLLQTDSRWGILNFIQSGGNTANYIPGADNSTAVLRTETNLRGRASMLRMYRFLKTLPGLENVKLVSMSPEVGVRETFRIKGEYLITQDDYTSGRTYPDAVCYAYYPIDLHDKNTGVHPAHLAEGKVATVPLRALIPAGAKNLLVAGRCISSDRYANSALRVEATCMATGQAAGEAAALAAKLGVTPGAVPIEQLHAGLVARRAVVPPTGSGERRIK
jgi:2-polyprenyl-6-methoxyphenol hydroxylase-like FAD-dependent oxidoreductase